MCSVTIITFSHHSFLGTEIEYQITQMLNILICFMFNINKEENIVKINFFSGKMLSPSHNMLFFLITSLTKFCLG